MSKYMGPMQAMVLPALFALFTAVAVGAGKYMTHSAEAAADPTEQVPTAAMK